MVVSIPVGKALLFLVGAGCPHDVDRGAGCLSMPHDNLGSRSKRVVGALADERRCPQRRKVCRAELLRLARRIEWIAEAEQAGGQILSDKLCPCWVPLSLGHEMAKFSA